MTSVLKSLKFTYKIIWLSFATCFIFSASHVPHGENQELLSCSIRHCLHTLLSVIIQKFHMKSRNCAVLVSL